MSWGKEWPQTSGAPEPLWPDLKQQKTFNEIVDHLIDSSPTAEELYSGMSFKKLSPDPIKPPFSNDPLKERNNLSPTHDPYTNPNAHIYYECKCGAILDPGTKSFASLNNAASEAGWKVRWKTNGEGYQPYCIECGKDVE